MNLSPLNGQSPTAVQRHGLWQQPVLDGENARGQRRRVVCIEYVYRLLQNDHPGVQNGLMHVLYIETTSTEGRDQRRMDVDDAVRIRRHRRAPHDTQIPREHDEVDLVLRQSGCEGSVVRNPSTSSPVDQQCRDTMAACPFQHRRGPVRDDDGHGGIRYLSLFHCRHDRLTVSTIARRQDGDARHRQSSTPGSPGTMRPTAHAPSPARALHTLSTEASGTMNTNPRPMLNI